MTNEPSFSTDQISAFVELARTGSLRGASDVLHISEQGARNRLLALEGRLGVELYRKSRGVRRVTPLTAEGQRFLPHAIAFLERAQELCQLFDEGEWTHEVNVVASHYLIAYVLIGAVQQFHDANPKIRIRLKSRTEEEVEASLLADPTIALGVAAPFESPADLGYDHLFSMNWSLITHRRHELAKRSSVRLVDIASEPLVLYERGSTGRQHIMDAFREKGLAPQVEMEATTTDVIVRMVEAGLGVSIVPLLPSGIITKGRQVKVVSLGRQIRPIDSGLLTRRGQQQSKPAAAFVEFIKTRMKTGDA